MLMDMGKASPLEPVCSSKKLLVVSAAERPENADQLEAILAVEGNR